MAAYIELRCKGGQMAYIEVGMIGGVVTSPDMDAYVPATEAKPVMLVLRAGATLETVGQSAALILTRMRGIREHVRKLGLDIAVDFLNAEAGGADGDEVQEPVG
jgi:hypothetical protein